MPFECGTRSEDFHEGAIKNAILSNRRPHLVFGTREFLKQEPPRFLPPLLHSMLQKYDPAKMKLTSEEDRPAIIHIVEQLHRHVLKLKVGYIGQISSAGLAHGDGTLEYEIGNRYDGCFCNDMKHGFGKFMFANGDTYVGWYENDKRNGQGTSRYATGGMFTGGWKDDLNHGWGVDIWANGDKYEGEYKEGLKHGRGKMTYSSDGRVEAGFWGAGRFVGNSDAFSS